MAAMENSRMKLSYFDARGVDAAGLVVAGLQTLYREADDRLRAARRAVRR